MKSRLANAKTSLSRPRRFTESFECPAGGGGDIELRRFSFHAKNANQVWPGNRQLMEFLLEHPALYAAPRRVLELGSATGLLALFLTRLGADVTTSDLEEEDSLVAGNIEHNFVRNGQPPVVSRPAG